jgi:hypothetical protein
MKSLRLRARWVLVASAAILFFLLVALWPREDPYRFIRRLDPIEAVRPISLLGLGHTYDERTFSFRQPPREVEQMLLDHYFTGRRVDFGLPEFVIASGQVNFQWTGDGSWPPDVQCRIVIVEESSWLSRQLDSLKRILRIN